MAFSSYQPYVAPGAVMPTDTAAGATSGAIGLGNLAYQQLPGYNASLGNIGQNIQSETAGELPPEVIAQMQQQAAERGISTGSPGSPNSNAAYLRAIGDTSLNLTQQGQANFQSILPSLPGGQISQNPNFYVNPGLQYQAGETNAANQAGAANTNAQMANSLKAVQAGYGAGLGAGNYGMPQLGFGAATPNIDSGAGGPANPPAVGAIGGGTSIGGQMYYGDTANIASQIQQKYAGTVTGNLQGNTPDEPSTDSYADYGGAGSYDDYYGGDYGGDYGG